jgi:hypothetical protein
MENRAKTITTAERHTKDTPHTSTKRVSSRAHKRHHHHCSPRRRPPTLEQRLQLYHRLVEPTNIVEAVGPHEDLCQNSTSYDKTTQLRLWCRTKGEPDKVGAAEDHRTAHLSPVIVRHRGLATAASTSQQQTNRGKPTDTPKKSRLPQPKPRLQHRSTPSSLPQKPWCKHLAFH